MKSLSGMVKNAEATEKELETSVSAILVEAAKRATATGNRLDLQRYLRLRKRFRKPKIVLERKES